jgi:hypothetical protein
MKIVFFILLCLFAQTSFAFRCGNNLVSNGDTQYEVKDICGEPSDISKRSVYMTYTKSGYEPCLEPNIRLSRIAGSNDLVCIVGAEEQIAKEVQIEEWLYDLGTTRLMRRVTFENGKVVKIESLGRGR